jgi:hypothetical protein
MANNYDEYEYDDGDYNNKGNDGTNILNKIGILLLIVIAIIIIVVLINGCSKRNNNNNNNGEIDPGPTPEVVVDYDSALLQAAKKYFENNRNEYPTSIGDCVQVTLQELITRGYISADALKNCNSIGTYVRVCKLENGTIQYTPWFSCNDKQSETEYGDSIEGSLNSVFADSTYVDFMFLPQVLQNGQEQLGKVEEVWKDDISYVNYKTLATTTYYRYKDQLFKWNVTSKLYYTTYGEKTEAKDVNEYYTSAPSSKYQYSDNKTTEAYKWYTTTSKKEYALASNGAKAFSTSAIGDYNLYEGGVSVTYYKYRTVTGQRNPTHYYACATSSTSPYLVFQTTTCPSAHNPEYKVQRFDFYSCADPNSQSDSIYGNQVKSTDKCLTYSAWSDPIKEDPATGRTCPAGSTDQTCVKVTKIFYNWYKLVDGGDRTYYPSGASSASGERVYYTSAPVSNAIKDPATKTTAYKWYAQTSTTTSSYTAVAPGGYIGATKTDDSKWSDWSKWSKSNPKISDGRNRQIESKVKIKLQEIKGSTSTDWKDLAIEYMTKEQMILAFQNKGYKVNTLDDINNNGEIRYQTKMFVRNKKGVN